MGIDLVWLDATGKQRDVVPDPSSVLSAAIERVREGPWRHQLLIGRIDPCGDTRFSSGQAPQLLREFADLRNASNDPGERIAIGHVVSVLRAAEGIQDEWLGFFGD
jgi:hypothetical protein